MTTNHTPTPSAQATTETSLLEPRQMTTFKDLPIGNYYIEADDPDGYVCRKISESEAIDATCGKGFCFEVRPDQKVIV